MDSLLAAINSGDLAQVEEALAREGVRVWRAADTDAWAASADADRSPDGCAANPLVGP